MKLVETKKNETINYDEKVTVEITLRELAMIKTAIGRTNSRGIAVQMEENQKHLVLARILKDVDYNRKLYLDLVELSEKLFGGKEL